MSEHDPEAVEVRRKRPLAQESGCKIDAPPGLGQSVSRGRARRLNNEACPKCGVSLQGDPIPEREQESFGATHFSRKIGIYSREQDRTVAWRCPDCDHEWSRD